MKAPKPKPSNLTAKSTQAERQQLLEELFNEQIRGLVEQLKKEPTAALLNVARQTLADNGVSHHTLSEEERTQDTAKAMAREIETIPEFPQHYS